MPVVVVDVDGLKPLAEVLERDERWRVFCNRTIDQHHALIAEYSLRDRVPDIVAQHFENSTNTWLYAFFSYRLPQVALMQVHVTGEAASKSGPGARASTSSPKAPTRWRSCCALRWSGAGCWLLVAQRLADAFRTLRNSLAHAEVLLDPNLGWPFLAV